MRRLILCTLAVGLLAGLVLLQAVALAAELQVPIQISPNTLVKHSMGDCFTVHADIAFSQVDPASLSLNGLSAIAAFADDRGDLVAKLDIAAVKGMVEPPSATFTLTGKTDGGVAFEGAATIRVKD